MQPDCCISEGGARAKCSDGVRRDLQVLPGKKKKKKDSSELYAERKKKMSKLQSTVTERERER